MKFSFLRSLRTRNNSRGTLALWKRALLILAFPVIVAGGALTAYAMLVSIPSIDNFENRRVAESTKIFDRTGNVLLYDVHGTIRRTEVPIDQISPYIRNATIAIEDDTFYQHFGFRPLSFLRAVLVNITTGSYSQGGSTITQQVVKNTLLTQDKKIIRKLKEIVLAIKLERILTKDQILQIYLNETGYGGTIYGVEEASEYFYGKHASEVTLAEAAYLAALPQAPTRYSPYGNHKDELEARKNLVLTQMKTNGFITEDEYEGAMAEKVEFKDTKEAGIKAPHFVFFVREYLEEKYGADAVANGGLRVITTLDWDLQQKAEQVVEEHARANETNFNAENAGLVAIDPKTGQILSMVGSRAYFDPDIDGKVNVTVAPRQPGSSFKPFVYAAAFEKGYTPDTILFDLQTQFSTACSPSDYSNNTPPCYAPGNYDEKFRGPMSLRDALAQSINVVAVKVLYLVGIHDAIHMAERLGITTLAGADRYGLTLVLGGGEVKLLEMVSAYASFADDGVRNPHTGILEVRDAAGNVLETYEQHEERVLEPQISRLITSVLSDNEARIPEFGANSPLYFPGYDVAAKTGTTNDFRDAWILGYSTSIAAGAWAGNNDNSPMEKRIAAFIVTPMWHEFMEYALEKYPPQDFPEPAPDTQLDSISPILKGEWNVDPLRGAHSILYWVDKDHPRSGAPTNAAADPQFSYWEYPISIWAGQNPVISPINPGAGGGDFRIIIPIPNATLSGNAPIPAAVAYPIGAHVRKVTYYLNGDEAGSATQPPFYASLRTEQRGQVQLRAVFETDEGDIDRTVSFTVR